MTDILIRAVPGAVLDEIDRQARELGVSRNEFLRRRLSREFRRAGWVSTEDLVRLAELIRGADDPADEAEDPGADIPVAAVTDTGSSAPGVPWSEHPDAPFLGAVDLTDPADCGPRRPDSGLVDGAHR